MEEARINKLMEQHNFTQNNGYILRTLHILSPKERRLGSIRFLMKDIPIKDLRNSLLYLQEADYIRIDHPDGAGCLNEKNEVGGVKVSITSQGMELLMGLKDNPAIDV